MSFIKKYIVNNENKWVWFIFTLLGSIIPLIARLLVSLGFPDITSIFDIKDLLFAGLAMNLSNLNLVSSKSFKEKVIISALSAILILFIGILISIFLCKGDKDESSLPILKLISIIFVLLSIGMSYEANCYVLNE